MISLITRLIAHILRDFVTTPLYNYAVYGESGYGDSADQAEAKARERLQFQKDSKNQILYLRSFSADDFTYGVRIGQGDRRETYKAISFETRLSLSIGKIGRLTKVGKWMHYEKDVAHRIDVPDDLWEKEVLALMRSSAMIILRPALSGPLTWELKTIIEEGLLSRTIICYSRIEDDKLNYNIFREVNSDLLRLPKIRLGNCFTCFNDANKPRKRSALEHTPLYQQLAAEERARIKRLNIIPPWQYEPFELKDYPALEKSPEEFQAEAKYTKNIGLLTRVALTLLGAFVLFRMIQVAIR